MQPGALSCSAAAREYKRCRPAEQGGVLAILLNGLDHGTP